MLFPYVVTVQVNRAIRLAWYNSEYEGEESKIGITDEGDDWRDSAFLGDTYEEALKALQALVPNLRKQTHIYNG